jgi:hypothetical protein
MEEAKLRSLARFAEQNGAHTKAEMLRGLADDIELYRPVVVALMEEDEADEFDRERLEERIVELDGEIDG